MGSKDADPVKIGYEYKLGVQYMFSQDGITNVREINLSKQRIFAGNITSNSSVVINRPNHYGGLPPEGSGGFVATIDMMFGGPSQGVNTYLKNTLHGGSSRVPAYRGRFCMVFRGGPEPYLGEFNFWTGEYRSSLTSGANWGTSGNCEPVSALLSGDAGITWYTAKKWVTVSGATYPELNPIHMIYYWLNSNRNGLAIAGSGIDDVSFMAAADTIYTEGLGLSFLFSADNSVQVNINEILNHIDAAIFQDPTDGLFKIKLIRDDFDVGDLLVLDDSNSTTLDIYDTGFDELVNQLTVEYYNLENNTISHVGLHDLGLRNAMGGYTVLKKIRYNGVNSRELALTLATRDMLALSRPLKRIRLAANRDAAGLQLGSVFKWTNADEGVTDLVMRVHDIKYGGLKDRKIEIECIQDVFSFGTEVYDAFNPEDWEDPAEIEPVDLANVELLEVPYWYYWYKFNGLPDDGEAGDGSILTLATRETQADEFYRQLEKLSAEGFYSQFYENGDFCPHGYLDSAGITFDMMALGSVTVVLQDAELLTQVRANSAAYINGSILKVLTVEPDTGEVELGMGAADTVAKEHAANSLVYFFGFHGGIINDGYTDGDTVNVKLLTKTPYTQLVQDDATAHTITLDERADKPYPPAKLRFNGAAYPLYVMGILTISWAHRDREGQAGELFTEVVGDIGPEAGTNYEIRGYNESGVLKWQPDTPATSDTWDYEDTDSANSDGLYNKTMRFRLWSTREGLISHEEHDYTVTRVDWGYGWGLAWGGVDY